MPWPISPAPATNTRSIVTPESYPVPARRAGRVCPARPAAARFPRTPGAPTRRRCRRTRSIPTSAPEDRGRQPEREVDERGSRPDDGAPLRLVDASHGEGHEGREQEGDPEREDGRPDIDADRAADQAEHPEPEGGSHERDPRQARRADLVRELREDDPEHDHDERVHRERKPGPAHPELGRVERKEREVRRHAPGAGHDQEARQEAGRMDERRAWWPFAGLALAQRAGRGLRHEERQQRRDDRHRRGSEPHRVEPGQAEDRLTRGTDRTPGRGRPPASRC